jgi:hypothetical protein
MALYEKKLRSLAELNDELKTLDADGGVRIRGIFEGKPCFVFVTRYRGRFGVSIFSTKKGTTGLDVPDQSLSFRHFSEGFELVAFVRSVALQPLEAYSY